MGRHRCGSLKRATSEATGAGSAKGPVLSSSRREKRPPKRALPQRSKGMFRFTIRPPGKDLKQEVCVSYMKSRVCVDR